jgi:hypothetical protein
MVNEYRWVPFMYVGYAAALIGVLVLGFTVPDLGDNIVILLITLMAVIYTGALTALCVRALKRIEIKLGTMSDEGS